MPHLRPYPLAPLDSMVPLWGHSMKLTYWIAKPLDHEDTYTIRERTRREVVASKRRSGDLYSNPKKVTAEYYDGFSLAVQCLGDGGGYWES